MPRLTDDNGIPIVAVVSPTYAAGGQPGGAGASLGSSNVFKPKAATAITAGTAVSFWAPAAGKKPRLRGMGLATTVGAQIIVKMGASAGAAVEVFRTPTLVANTPYQIADDDLGQGILAAAANDQVFLDVTVSGSVSGTLWGTEE